jgi:type II secretory pathway pseudopilin PulG
MTFVRSATKFREVTERNDSRCGSRSEHGAKLAVEPLLASRELVHPNGVGPARSGGDEQGFTLVAVMIGIAILTILIAAIAPTVATVMKRDRETELIFRGKQYARAIALFQRRYGRYPNELKELYENRPRTIRHLWKDPICNCDWYPLIQGAVDSVGGPGVPGTNLAGGATTPTPAPALTPTPLSPFAQSSQPQTVGPIIGVRSTVHKEALQQWRGSNFYDQWKFLVGDADRDYMPGSQQSLNSGLPASGPVNAPTKPPGF